MEDRRESKRVQLHLPAHCQTTSGIYNGTIINGSVGGCFMLAQVEEPDDEPIKLAIPLPTGESIELWGEVAYHLPTKGFGLQFTNRSDECQAMLNIWREYLHTLAQDQHHAPASTT